MEIDKDLLIIAEDIKKMDFKNNSIIVTGATGLLGSLIVKGFLEANKIYALNNTIYAFARNIDKAKKVFGNYINEINFNIVQHEITQPINLKANIDYIFHTACVTTSKEMVTNPVELVKTSICGTMNILDYANYNKVKSVVYLSSMETYGVVESSDKRLKEEDLGFLDLSSVRSCYPESKRLNENLCKCYASEYGLNVCTARLTQTFGAGAVLEDNRIFAHIAKSVVFNKDLVLKTTGILTRDYCYTTDAIFAILILSKKGKSGEIYNIANESTTISVYEMAQMVVEKINNGKNKLVLDVQQDVNSLGFSPASKTQLDCSKMKSLGWSPKFDLEQMYKKLISSYRDILDMEN